MCHVVDEIVLDLCIAFLAENDGDGEQLVRRVIVPGGVDEGHGIPRILHEDEDGAVRIRSLSRSFPRGHSCIGLFGDRPLCHDYCCAGSDGFRRQSGGSGKGS